MVTNDNFLCSDSKLALEMNTNHGEKNNPNVNLCQVDNIYSQT